uniref:Uncharacterized protein n=1 Tax=Branchiostoma floridae TaxID=7739 RepID=C3YQ44_BRAFL|eukprot:XP_002601537.1 hypothetical protein BRAFLDRAFT_95776 [Branchiostoma floridae]
MTGLWYARTLRQGSGEANNTNTTLNTHCIVLRTAILFGSCASDVEWQSITFLGGSRWNSGTLYPDKRYGFVWSWRQVRPDFTVLSAIRCELDSPVTALLITHPTHVQNPTRHGPQSIACVLSQSTVLEKEFLYTSILKKFVCRM